jgi:hypothetical protein
MMTTTMLPLSSALAIRSRFVMAMTSAGHSNLLFHHYSQAQPQLQQLHQHPRHPQQYRSMGHLVRVILREDLPSGKGRVREVVEVPAGFARNFLIPKKKALYATADNLQKLAEAHKLLGITPEVVAAPATAVGGAASADPTTIRTITIKPPRVSVPSKKKQKKQNNVNKIFDDFTAAARLKHYLRNKHVRVCVLYYTNMIVSLAFAARQLLLLLCSCLRFCVLAFLLACFCLLLLACFCS